MRLVTSSELRVFFAWQPVLPSDVRSAAARHARAEADPRARHYWDDGLRLGRAYAGPLHTPYPTEADGDPLAWDVIIVYPRGREWGPDLPEPALHMFPRAFSIDKLRVELESRLDGR